MLDEVTHACNHYSSINQIGKNNQIFFREKSSETHTQIYCRCKRIGTFRARLVTEAGKFRLPVGQLT